MSAGFFWTAQKWVTEF
jgi:hypothetical protein